MNKKDQTIPVTTTQKVFLLVGISLSIVSFIIVYLHDTNTVVLNDPTWYKIMATSSMATVGGYLFGSSTARIQQVNNSE